MLSTSTVEARVAAAAGIGAAAITPLVAAVQAFIEEQTGRYFGTPVSLTEYLPGSGEHLLYLTHNVASGAVTVTERTAPSQAAVAFTAFETRDGRVGSLLRTDGLSWRRFYEYALTYTHGYAIDSAPADVLELALDLVALRLNLAGQEGMQSERLGAYSFARGRNDDLEALPGALDTIRRWRRPVFA